MKKILAMVLALVLCLSLCACGSASKEDVVGTYAYASGIYDDVGLFLRDDSTYDWGDEKGTYKINGNKIILTSKYNKTTTFVKQDDICYLESSLHPLKNDYGQPVTFSKEGRINHEFYWPDYEGNNGASYRLTLCEDGSFTLTVRSSMRLEIEGTYSLENNILTLTSGDSTYYFVCTKDGFTKNVYKKFTTEAVKYWLIEEPPLPEPPAE